MKKRIVSILLAVFMIASIVPFSAIPASAENVPNDTGKYIARSWDSTGKQVVFTEEDIPEDAKEITAATRELTSGWYVLSESVTLPGGAHITVDGKANLVLCDGCELKIPSPDANCAGIELSDGGTFGASDSLTVYGQKNGTGSIVAYGGFGAAGIGSNEDYDCGNITINGGSITAYGGRAAAGIGGGSEGDCGNITVYGGTVTATGSSKGAGIGNGDKGIGGSITVYGGTVKAYGNGEMAIGGESGIFSKTKIHIYGGDILADSRSNNDAVVAYSTTVYADTHNKFTAEDAIGAALPFSPLTEQKDLYKDLPGHNTVHIKMQPVHSFDKYVNNGDGTHSLKCSVCGEFKQPEKHNFEHGACSDCEYVCVHTFVDEVCTVCGINSSENKYIDRSWDEETGQVISTEKDIPANAKRITEDTTELSGGWYVVSKNADCNSRIVVKGTADDPTNIILLDDVILVVNPGIGVSKGYVLNIYGQTNDTGAIYAYNAFKSAGIGGGDFDLDSGRPEPNDELKPDGGTITVSGGTIFASSSDGAGIGGGEFGNGGTVTVNGGIVSARSKSGAGVGGGKYGNGGSYTVNGGMAEASSSCGAGIGGGEFGGGGSFTMNGGTLLTQSLFGVSFVRASENNEAGTVTLGKDIVVYDITGGEPGVLVADNVIEAIKNIPIAYLCTEKQEQVLPTTPFDDVPADAWFTDAVLWCNENGYMTGTGEKTFSPNANLTRAQFVQILAKVAGADLGAVEYTGKFTDVPADAWYTKAVEWASANGITGGTSKTTFSPDALVTREQLATFFLAYAKSCGYDVTAAADLGKYTDADTVSDWARNAVQWAVAEGMISGTTATTLSPKFTATRAQTAVILKSFIEGFSAE